MTRKKTEENIVLDTCTIILDRPDSVLSIPIIHNKRIAGTIRLQFLEDRKDKKLRIKSEADGEFLNLMCYNFNSEVGSFSTEPIAIGIIEGKRVSLQVFSNLMGREKKVRFVNYTLYEGIKNV